MLDVADAGRRVAGTVGTEAGRALLRARNGVAYARGEDLRDVFSTPKDVIWARDKARLLRIRSDRVAHGKPLLIVHSLISRSSIFDLLPENSVVAWLRDHGHDVHLLDWGVPDDFDVANDLATYVDDLLPRALAAVREWSGAEDVAMLGYCYGGVLALLALATGRAAVRDLALVATPVDFTGITALQRALRPGRLSSEDLLDATGNVPPKLFRRAFRVLRPTNDLSAYATLADRLWDMDFVRGHHALNRWTADQIPFPGALMRESLELVRDNGLMRGTARVGARRVDFAGVDARVVAFMATRDHLAPYPSAAPIGELLPRSDVETVEIEGGHVSLLLGGRARRVTLPALHRWLIGGPAEVAGDGRR